MFKLQQDQKLSAVLVLALALGPISAWAQSETESQEAEGIEGDLSLGETVDEDAVQVGQIYPLETNDDWTVRCVKTQDGQDPCEMYQLLSDAQGTPIAEMTLINLPDGQPARAGASVVVPLETALQQQVTIRVDDNPAKRYPFAYCDPIGCHARIGLTEEEVDLYRRGAGAVLSIVPFRAPDQRVEVEVSLSGFTASFANITEINAR